MLLPTLLLLQPGSFFLRAAAGWICFFPLITLLSELPARSCSPSVSWLSVFVWGWIKWGSPWEWLLRVLGSLPSLVSLHAADTEIQVLRGGIPCPAIYAEQDLGCLMGAKSLVSPAHQLRCCLGRKCCSGCPEPTTRDDSPVLTHLQHLAFFTCLPSHLLLRMKLNFVHVIWESLMLWKHSCARTAWPFSFTYMR